MKGSFFYYITAFNHKTLSYCKAVIDIKVSIIKKDSQIKFFHFV